MRDALQELRSGKRFFAAREETKGLWSSARGEAQYTETRALAQGSDPPLASAPYGRPPLMVGRGQLLLRQFSIQSPPKRNRGLLLETRHAEICETADGASDQCL